MANESTSTSTSNADAILMRHYDGEDGEGESLTDVELAAHGEDVEAKLAGLESLGDAIRDTIGAEAAAVTNDRFAAMWSEIEASVSVPDALAAPESISSPVKQQSRGKQESPGLLAQISAWFDRYRSHVFTGAFAAAAAAVVVWFVRPPEKTVEYVEVNRALSQAPDQPTDPKLIPAALESNPTEVESLEVYDGSGVVLTIPSEDGRSPTVVLWLSPPENSVEGPI